MPASVQNISPLANASSIAAIPAWPSGTESTMSQKAHKPIRRYCLIVEEELDPREE
jgi:hypothetical protein